MDIISEFKALDIAGSFVFDMVERLDMPAHLKDAVTRKYIHTNIANLEIYGLDKIEQIIGRTVSELDIRMKDYWGTLYARQVNQMDDQVVMQQQPMVDTRTILSIAGLVRLQRMVKLPVISNNKTIGIFTLSHNLTHDLSLSALYQEYKVFYPKKIAVTKFLEHLHLSEYFFEPPTDAELNVLIEKVTYPRNKDLSARLFLAPKTIETHLLKLKHKIKNADLFILLSIMRGLDIN